MKKKKSIEEILEDAVKDWGIDEMISFLKDVHQIYDLFDVDPENDWVEKSVGEDFQTVRLIRTIYLISKLAENHAGRLCSFTIKYPKLYKKLEQAALDHGG